MHCGDIYLDSIVFLDIWVRESESSAVMGNNVWDFVGAHGLSLNAAELELSLLGVDLVSLISTFHVVEDSEELASLLNGDDVHNTEWELGVSSDLVVDLDESFLVFNDLNSLLTRNCISQSISKEYRKGNALSSFVGASAGSGGVNSS